MDELLSFLLKLAKGVERALVDTAEAEFVAHG